MTDTPARIGRRWRAAATVAAVALCYVPFLLTSPGRVSADTKQYLFLDPGGLMRSATSMWDRGMALGYVPHQNIGYLWPMGPWFWTMEALGLPDWVAQRLWWGSLFVAAGAGVLALTSRFGWRREARIAAALVYALTPYSLAFLARISAILLAWAALPWLVLLAALSVRSRGWRHPALFAVVVATAGSSNLTSVLLVGLGALVWLVHVTLIAREEPLGEAVRAVGRIGLLTLGAAAWWLTGLVVQAGHGSEILRYSETAEAVASASSANEILRGLGNWFFYGADRLGPWIEQSVPYSQNLLLLFFTHLVPIVALAAAGSLRWRHRAFAVGLLVVGLLLSIGAYPWADPPPLGRLVKAVLLNEQGLALRALNRATPLLVLGMALVVGGAITALATRSVRASRAAAAIVAVIAIAGLPSLWTGSLVPTNLARDEEIPGYWQEAAAHLDASGSATRVLEIPGSDFAAYRWGNAVDAITPGLVERPVAYRELIPFAPPEAAALLGAFDLGLQERTLPPSALAPIARLLRAGDLLVRSDLEFERFNTPRPKNLWDLVARAPGLGAPVAFGPGLPNRPDPDASLDDEVYLLSDHLLADPPEVAVVPVTEPVPLVTTHAVDHPVVISGDAFGIVDMAGAGLIDGSELLQFSAGLEREELERAIDSGATFVITDTNRKRAQRWTSIRRTQGFTETEGGALLERDLSDNRLPFFDDAGTSAKTVAVLEGAVAASASSAGSRFAFTPEDRPSAAVDGDPTTSWRAGGGEDPRGEYLRLTLDDPITTNTLRLLQPTAKQPNRWITEVELRFDGRSAMRVQLDESSRTAPGQALEIPSQTFSELRLEITDVTAAPRTGTGAGSVGFAEVGIGSDEPVVEEWIRTPTDLLDRTGPFGLDQPVAVVLTRLRSDATEYIHEDDERHIARILELPSMGPTQVEGTARLSARARDSVLERVVGRGGNVVVESDGRLEGSLLTGAAALDGDPTTWWMSPRSAPTGFGMAVTVEGGATVRHLDLQVVADGRFSVPTELTISADGGAPLTVPVGPVPPTEGAGSIATVSVDLPVAVVGRAFTIEITGAAPTMVRDWVSGEPIAQPVAVAELGIEGVAVPGLATTFDSGCRDDLVEVDGRAVPVRITGPMADAMAGRALPMSGCVTVGDLVAGEHRILTAKGRDLGIDVDQIVLRNDAATAAGARLQSPREAPASTTVGSTSSSEIEVELEGQPGATVWLVLGDSHDTGWTASSSGAALGSAALVDGFANGWQVTLDEAGRAEVSMRFAPQRFVRLALLLSLVTFLLCGLLAWRGRPASAAPVHAPSLRHRPLRPLRPLAARPTSAHLLLVGASTALTSLLVLPPRLCLITTAAAVCGSLWRWAGLALRIAPVVLATLMAAIVGADQILSDRPPGTSWATGLLIAHHLALLSVALLVVDVIIGRRWDEPARPAGRTAA